MLFKDFFFYFWIWWPFSSVEQNRLCNFGREHYGKHSIKTIFQFGPAVQGDHLKILFFSSGGHFVCRSKTICVILIKSIMKNNSNYFKF